jgi:hypothetical protein
MTFCLKFKDAQMQPDALLQLPTSAVFEIVMAGLSWQARVNELFRVGYE